MRRPVGILAPLLAVLLVFGLTGAARPAAKHLGVAVPPDASALANDVNVLAGPAMEGRASGTPGGERAAHTLARALDAAGLRPGGDAGTFFQSFVIATGTRIAPASRLDAPGDDGRSFALHRDWRPHGGSRRGEVTGEVVFVGYGLAGADAPWNDYAGVDVRGRIALALDGAPTYPGAPVASRLEKLIAARHAGASALLLAGDQLPSAQQTSAPVDIVSAAVTRATADTLLAPSGTTLSRLETSIGARRGPASFPLGGRRLRLDVVLDRDERRGVNVIGVLPGRDAGLTVESVVVGAHYDHLGVIDGVVHPGADDNASGTAIVLGLARSFAAAGGTPRTLVFAFFGGEELGLLGSRAYVAAGRPDGRVAAMVNLDMVGRLGGGALTVGGVDSGVGLRPLVAEAAATIGVPLRTRAEPFSPSDQLQFYRAGTPVLFFHTGSHADYHRPTDTPDRIDADGMARIAAVAGRVVERLASGPAPSYVKLTPPARPRASGAGAGAFFGVVGDPRTSGDGVPLSDVLPGSAAERAGVRGGDVLVRFDGRPVNGFEELRRLLEQKKPGQRVELVYLRDGEDRTTSTTLDPRPQ